MVVVGPLLVLHLDHDPWLHPDRLGRLGEDHVVVERGCRPLDLAEMGGEDAESGVVEARAHGRNPAQPVIVVETDQDRAEGGRPPPSPGRYPPTTALSRRRTDTFRQSGDRRPGRYGDPSRLPTMPSRSAALANSNKRVPVLRGRRRDHDRRGQSEVHQASDSLLIGPGDQALIRIQQVEHHEIDPDVGLGPPATEAGALLEIGEGGLSVLVEGDHLAIDRHPVG